MLTLLLSMLLSPCAGYRRHPPVYLVLLHDITFPHCMFVPAGVAILTVDEAESQHRERGVLSSAIQREQAGTWQTSETVARIVIMSPAS